MYSEDSAPETNKTTKFMIGKAVEEKITTKAIKVGFIQVKEALLHCDWIWSRINTAGVWLHVRSAGNYLYLTTLEYS